MKKKPIVFLFYSIVLLSSSMVSANPPPSGCHSPVKVCVEPGQTRIIDGVAVHQDCWRYNVTYRCPNWTNVVNSCSDKLNCVATGPAISLDAYHKQQPMDCTTTTLKQICTAYKTVKHCKGKFSYTQGLDKFTTHGTKNFSDAAASMGAMDEMQKNMSVNPLSVFTGKTYHCSRPIKLGPFTVNCCDAALHTHEAKWYHVNHCSNEEIALATARRANRTHEMGDWCSKHLPFPLDFVCIESTQGACAFGSLFGRVVAEQGRVQINAIAGHGGTDTKTESFRWPYAMPVATWHKTTLDNVAIATYSWPMLSADKIPLVMGVRDPLVVLSGQSNHINDVTINTQCAKGRCSGVFETGGGEHVPYQLDPICSTPKQWVVGENSVLQNVCAKRDTTPVGWPSVTWHGNTPNLWQFIVASAFNKSIEHGQLTTLLPDGTRINGTSQCDGFTCTVNLSVQKGPHRQTGKLTFPLNCTSSHDDETTINGVTFAPRCHTKTEIFAVCTKGENCGALPNVPTTVVGNTINGWLVHEEPIQVSSKHFVTASVAVQGACTNNLCNWQLTSIGPKGFDTDIASNVMFNLFSAPIKNNKVTPGFVEQAIATPTNINLKPYAYAPGSDISQGFQLEYQLPGSNVWQTYPHAIPLSVAKSTPILLSSSPRVAFYGSCQQMTGNCHFTVLANVTVKAMPWGDAQNPQCEGFTTGELILLDFSKMDLSEWLKSISANFGPGQENQLNHLAKSSIDDFTHDMNNNGTENSPMPSQDGRVVMKVTPRQGQGPFTATLIATAFWPKYIPYGQCGYPRAGVQNKKVDNLIIHWGDGKASHVSATQTLSATGEDYQGAGTCTYTLPVFKVTHSYGIPPGHNAVEQVTGTFNVGGNTYHADFAIDNFYDTPTNKGETGGGAATARQNPVHPNQMPGSSPYQPAHIPGVQKNQESS